MTALGARIREAAWVHGNQLRKAEVAEQVAAEILEELGPSDEITRLRAVSGVMQDDMAELMEALGISAHARDASPHEVMVDEVVPEARRLRERVEELEGALEDLETWATEMRDYQQEVAAP